MVEAEQSKHDEIELAAIEAGADDIKKDGNSIEIYTDAKDLHTVKSKLEEAGITAESAEITYVPENEVRIDDETKARKVLRLMEVLEEDDDVANVYSNFDIPEEIMEKLG